MSKFCPYTEKHINDKNTYNLKEVDFRGSIGSILEDKESYKEVYGNVKPTTVIELIKDSELYQALEKGEFYNISFKTFRRNLHSYSKDQLEQYIDCLFDLLLELPKITGFSLEQSLIQYYINTLGKDKDNYIFDKIITHAHINRITITHNYSSGWDIISGAIINFIKNYAQVYLAISLIFNMYKLNLIKMII